MAARLHVRNGERSPRVGGRRRDGGGEDDLAGEFGEEGDLREGGIEEIKVGNEELGVRAADDAHFAARNAAVAEEKPGGGVGAGEADRVGAEGAFVVAGDGEGST